MALLAASAALSGLAGPLIDAGLRIGMSLYRRRERLGHLLPEVIQALALPLGQRYHVAGIVVDPGEPGGDDGAAALAPAIVPVISTRA